MTDTTKIEALLWQLTKLEPSSRKLHNQTRILFHYRNPEGPEAAKTIRSLMKENERLREGFQKIAKRDGLGSDRFICHDCNDSSNEAKALTETDNAG